MKQPLPKRQTVHWPDDTHYFLTVSTYLHYPYFQEDTQKHLILNFIKKLNKDWLIPIESFAVLINHIHLMFYADKGEKVTLVKRFLKNNVSREYRKIYEVKYKDFWYSTRIYWIKNEKAYWGMMGYTIGNLLKHKEVSNFQELYETPFSSFRYIADKCGYEVAQELVQRVIAAPEDSYGEIDLKGLTAVKTA